MNEERAQAGKRRDERQTVSFGPFRFDRRGLLLSTNDGPLSVQPKALLVLRCLVERPGEVLLKRELMDMVWNDAVVTENSLAEAIRMLRQALGDDPRSPEYIETVHRRGYRFIAAVHTTEATVRANGAVARSSATAAARASIPAAAPLDESARTSGRWRTRLGMAAMFVSGGVIVAAAMWVLAGENPGVAVTTFAVGAPPGATFFSGAEALAISPDGSKLVFGATDGIIGPSFFTRRLDDLDLLNLTATVAQRPSHPFFSPDGRRVGFFTGTDAGVETLDLVTGETKTICIECVSPAGRAGGGAFGPGGSVVFAHDGTLWRVPADGGDRQVVPAAALEGPAAGYWWPSFLPGGEWIVVTMLRGHNIRGAQLGAVHLPTGETRILVDDAVSGRYVASGHLVFARDGNLWAVSFDPDAMQPRGLPALIPSTGLQVRDSDGFAAFTVSATGTLAFHPGLQWREEHRVVSSDLEGNSEPLIGDTALYRAAQLSPDGSKLAVCFRDTADEIRVYDFDLGGEHFSISTPGADVCDPIWSPSGTMLAFWTAGSGIFVQEASPRAEPRRIVRSESWLQPMDWAANGEIVYLLGTEDGGIDIWTVDVQSEEPRPFLATDRDETTPRVSPDGNWLAYSLVGSDPGSRPENWQVKVVPFPGGGPPIDIGEGMAPRWAPDGRELYYYRPRDGWVAVPLEGGMDLIPGEPRRLGLDFRGLRGIQPHGDRFVQIEGHIGGAPRTTEIIVVLNWFETLRELAPPGR